MNKKVVILHPAYWEQAIGGAEIQISYLVKYLVDKGIEVHFIFENKGSLYDNLLNINLHPLKKINLSKRFGNRWFMYRKRINKLLDDIQPDAIYTRFYSSWSGFAAEYSNNFRIPHVWAIASNNDLSKNNNKRPFYKFLDRIEDRIVLKAFKYSTHILVQNRQQEDELKKRYNRNGIFLTQAALFDSENDIKKPLNKIIVVWIANLKDIKRPELYLEIVNKFNNNEAFEFKMIGRPHPKYMVQIKRCEAKNNNFSYLNELNNEKVNTILLGSHILINTSDYEGFSNTFIQAWHRENIVISMNSNPDEILSTQKIGYLISDIDKIVATLKYLAQNKNELLEMGKRAFTYSKEHHNLNNNLRKVSELLNV